MVARTMAATLMVVPKNEQRSVIWFLMLENVLGGESHIRKCVVYAVQTVITKSTVNRWVQRFKARRTSMRDKPRKQGTVKKRRTLCGKLQASTNSSIDMKNVSLHMAIMSKSRL